MKINIAKEVMRVNINSQIKGIEVQPLIFAGKPGTSKTRTIEALAKELNYAFLNVSCPTMTSEELSGLPNFTETPNMSKYSLVGSSLAQGTEWTVCNLIADANRLADEHNGCVLLLDDLHELNLSTAPYMYSLLEERALGQYRLDSRVAIVGAMNDSDEANFNGLASPIKDRCSILPVEFDFDHWYETHGKFLNFKIASFIKINPQYVQEDESTEIEQFLTPRSCTYFGNELDEYDNKFISNNAYDLALMKMSKTAAVAFAKHIEYLDKINFEKLVKERTPLDVSTMSPLDGILHSYITNHIVTKSDAEYLISLIESNIDEASFLGFMSGELYTKYQIKQKGKPITKGIELMIDALLNPSTSELKIPNRDKFYSYIVEFL